MRTVRNYQALLDQSRGDICTFASSTGRTDAAEEHQGHIVLCYAIADKCPWLLSRYCCFFEKGDEIHLQEYKRALFHEKNVFCHRKFGKSILLYEADVLKKLFRAGRNKISLLISAGFNTEQGCLELYRQKIKITDNILRKERKDYWTWRSIRDRTSYPSPMGFAATAYRYNASHPQRQRLQRIDRSWLRGVYANKEDAAAAISSSVCKLVAAHGYYSFSGVSEVRGDKDFRSYFNCFHAALLEFHGYCPRYCLNPLKYIFGVLPIYHIRHILGWINEIAGNGMNPRFVDVLEEPDLETDTPDFNFFYNLFQGMET
jgi:hypothetical protein